jgi:hypothetical protein
MHLRLALNFEVKKGSTYIIAIITIFFKSIF